MSTYARPVPASPHGGGLLRPDEIEGILKPLDEARPLPARIYADPDGNVRIYYNVCRHRAMLVAAGAGNQPCFEGYVEAQGKMIEGDPGRGQRRPHRNPERLGIHGRRPDLSLAPRGDDLAVPPLVRGANAVLEPTRFLERERACRACLPAPLRLVVSPSHKKDKSAWRAGRQARHARSAPGTWSVSRQELFHAGLSN